jgi:hypothetical protein
LRHTAAPIVIAALLAACGGKDAAAPDRGVASLVRVGGDQQIGTAGATLGAGAAVEARDDRGLPLAGIPIRFTVTGGAGALSDTVVVTGADGRAVTTWILGPSAGQTQSLRAGAGSVHVDFTATANTPVAGQSYFGRNGYIEYIAGDLPIIITAPHGGTLVPAEIPDRTGTGVTTVRDTNVEELARTISNVFASQTGGRPHVIIVRLRRTKLDANREIIEAALGNRFAGRAWIEFHAFVEAAKQAVIATHGTGFYIDLHGHGHAISRLELGYLLSSGVLGLTDANLNAGTYESQSSIRTQSEASPASFAEILRGATSLGARFENAGFASVPSPASPGPGTAEYFDGGYNTGRHASRNGGPISGVQIESHFVGVRDTQASREAFATALTSVLTQYLAHPGAGVARPLDR